MAESSNCLGHILRYERRTEISRAIGLPLQKPDTNKTALIKMAGETSLKELEEKYAKKHEWKVIEGGGVLSVPVEEFRMINPPKPDREGKVRFEEKKGKGIGNLLS